MYTRYISIYGFIYLLQTLLSQTPAVGAIKLDHKSSYASMFQQSQIWPLHGPTSPQGLFKGTLHPYSKLFGVYCIPSTSKNTDRFHMICLISINLLYTKNQQTIPWAVWLDPRLPNTFLSNYQPDLAIARVCDEEQPHGIQVTGSFRSKGASNKLESFRAP